jgi:tripartite-type tricarboxylate transporter receptor subunit TctC
MIMKRLIVFALAAAVYGTSGLNTALSQAYPSRPITLIVPYPAGGPTDSLARLLTEHMRVSLGQSIVIENVTGAGGSIGVGRVARAAPDGYTFGIGQVSSNTFNGAVYKLPYDLLKDFEPIALLTIAPMWMIGRASLPPNNINELIAWLRANGDTATAAAIGMGSASHLCGLYFQNHTGTRFSFVPYRGAAPANQDLIAGQIDLFCPEASNSLPLVRGGKVKAFAVLSQTRWTAAPDIPTMDEAGVPGVYIPFWHGFWAPRGTPNDAIAKLNAATVAALSHPTLRHRLIELGQEIPPREQLSPEALGAFQKSEIEKWWPIIRAANIKAE